MQTSKSQDICLRPESFSRVAFSIWGGCPVGRCETGAGEGNLRQPKGPLACNCKRKLRRIFRPDKFQFNIIGFSAGG
jgi:hypothetical protein